MKMLTLALVAVYACLCASHPVDKAPEKVQVQFPLLQPLPSEVLYKAEKPEPLVLECFTAGKEAGVKYSWKKDGKDYPFKSSRDNEGTLVIQNPTAADEGDYQCLAESHLGIASSRIVHVKRAFIEIPKVTLKKHKPVEGRTYKLECDIPKAYPKPTIIWSKEKASGEIVTVADHRFTISPEGTLYISSVEKEDVDPKLKYICAAQSPAVEKPVVLAEHLLEDLVEDKEPKTSDVIEQYVSQDMVAKIGDTTLIYCIFGGVPLAHPDWFKDGKDVNNSPDNRVTRYNKSVGKRLLIKETWLEDEGQYTCNVDNEKGKAKNHTMKLTVVSAPQFTEPLKPHVTTKPGQEVRIECKLAGIPPPKLIWTYNSQPLVESDRVHTHLHNAGNTTTSDLHIKKVEVSDKGYYGCMGVNEHGDIYSETLLYVA